MKRSYEFNEPMWQKRGEEWKATRWQRFFRKFEVIGMGFALGTGLIAVFKVVVDLIFPS